MYSRGYLQVNLGQIRGGKCSENPNIYGDILLGKMRSNFLLVILSHSGASPPPIGRGANIYPEISVHAVA